ncbi:MAG: tetratricopeptide repeat protein [Bryobacteraceae bacterium]
MSSFDKVRQWFEGSHPDSKDTKEGVRLLDLGRFAEAEQCFLKAVSDLKPHSTPRRRQAHVLLTLATAQWKQKKLPEARENAQRARDLLEESNSKPGAEMAECLDLLGRLRLEEGDFDNARHHFKDALDIEKSASSPDLKTLAERYRRLAGAHSQAGRWDDAKPALELALEIAEKTYGKFHAWTAGCLIELGECQAALADHAAAKLHMERGLQIHRNVCGAASDEVARDYQSLAAAAQSSGDLESAVGYYEKSLHLRERQLGGDVAEFAMLLINLANVHEVEGRYTRAMELLQQAVGRLEGARDERLVGALNHLGAIDMELGRLEDASTVLLKARKKMEQAPAKHQDDLALNTSLLESLRGPMPQAPFTAPSVSGSLAWPPQSVYGVPAPVYAAPPPGPAPAAPAAPPPVDYGNPPPSAPPHPAGLMPQFAPPPVAPPVYAPQLVQGYAPVYPQAPAAGPPAYYAAPPPYYALAPTPPPPPEHSGSGMQLSFVRPDGSPFERSASQPTLHLTLLVPDGPIPQNAVAVASESAPLQKQKVEQKSAPEPARQEPQGLTGWDDLAFEFLKIA